MTTITTHPATPDRWDDVQHALTGGGDGASCQCAWWTLTNKEWQATTRAERERLLRTEVDSPEPPGILAYVDGEAAGWARIGPRPAQQRIVRTRNIIAATREPLNDASVWSLSCFVIRKEHRGLGLSAVLLNAATRFAADAGARLVEAYPVDTSSGTHSPNSLYHGTLALFLAAGFAVRGELKPGRPLATKSLV